MLLHAFASFILHKLTERQSIHEEVVETCIKKHPILGMRDVGEQACVHDNELHKLAVSCLTYIYVFFFYWPVSTSRSDLQHTVNSTSEKQALTCTRTEGCSSNKRTELCFVCVCVSLSLDSQPVTSTRIKQTRRNEIILQNRTLWTPV
jgi:hypothetical protein